MYTQESYLAELLPAYFECMLWSSVDFETGEPLDESFSESDLSPEAIVDSTEDCKGFVAENWETISCMFDVMSPAQCGHDFWLTRNGHGAGFWDRGYPVDVGSKLSESAKVYGEIDPMPRDNGLIYL